MAHTKHLKNEKNERHIYSLPQYYCTGTFILSSSSLQSLDHIRAQAALQWPTGDLVIPVLWSHSPDALLAPSAPATRASLRLRRHARPMFASGHLPLGVALPGMFFCRYLKSPLACFVTSSRQASNPPCINQNTSTRHPPPTPTFLSSLTCLCQELHQIPQDLFCQHLACATLTPGSRVPAKKPPRQGRPWLLALPPNSSFQNAMQPSCM